MAKKLGLKKTITRKIRRGGVSDSSEKVGATHPESESRFFSRPTSVKSKSKTKSKSNSKSKSKSKCKF